MLGDIGGPDTIEITAPVPHVSATSVDTITRERRADLRCAGHWPPLNVEEPWEIRDKKGSKELKERISCDVNYDICTPF